MISPPEGAKEALVQRILIGLSVVFYLFLFPHSIGGDGFVRYEGLLQLISQGELKPMVYSYVGPLIALPLYGLGYLAKDHFWWVSRFNTFVLLATAFFLWRFFRREWGGHQGRIFLLLFLCATMLPKHSTDFYSEVFSSCTIAVGLCYLLQQKWKVGGTLFLLSAWNAPGTMVAAALTLVYFAFQQRQWRFFLFPPLTAGGHLLENFLKFGGMGPGDYLHTHGVPGLLPYTGIPGFSYPIFFGLISVFFSAGKGLIFYMPGILFLFSRSLWTNQNSADQFLRGGAVYSLGLILVYARWWAWTGDHFWGPRFYLFISLWAAVALALYWPRIFSEFKMLFLWTPTVLLSLWVGAQGITWGQDFQEACHNRVLDISFMCTYVPEFSSLWRVFVVWPEIRGRKVAYLIFFALVAVAVLWRPAVLLVAQLWERFRLLAARYRLSTWRF
jgi:hypothetical protein